MPSAPSVVTTVNACRGASGGSRHPPPGRAEKPGRCSGEPRRGAAAARTSLPSPRAAPVFDHRRHPECDQAGRVAGHLDEAVPPWFGLSEMVARLAAPGAGARHGPARPETRPTMPEPRPDVAARRPGAGTSGQATASRRRVSRSRSGPGPTKPGARRPPCSRKSRAHGWPTGQSGSPSGTRRRRPEPNGGPGARPAGLGHRAALASAPARARSAHPAAQATATRSSRVAGHVLRQHPVHPLAAAQGRTARHLVAPDPADEVPPHLPMPAIGVQAAVQIRPARAAPAPMPRAEDEDRPAERAGPGLSAARHPVANPCPQTGRLRRIAPRCGATSSRFRRRSPGRGARPGRPHAGLS